MSIDLNPITSGYSTGLINDNFQLVEDELNNNVLRRDGLSTGEPNQMEVVLDMNGNAIINATTLLTDDNSLITLGEADSRYINAEGDTLEGALDMAGNALKVRVPVDGGEPARKDQLDSEISARESADAAITTAYQAADSVISAGYQAADSNIQDQLTGTTPLEASAFSEISWHGQVVENSVTIPDNKNAWSFGPEMTVASGQTITIGTGSFWTIAEGQEATLSVTNFDEGTL